MRGVKRKSKNNSNNDNNNNNFYDFVSFFLCVTWAWYRNGLIRSAGTRKTGIFRAWVTRFKETLQVKIELGILGDVISVRHAGT